MNLPQLTILGKIRNSHLEGGGKFYYLMNWEYYTGEYGFYVLSWNEYQQLYWIEHFIPYKN